ncbi:uncharacterized protein C6orf132 homolog [Schistocerca piceifrons]|uniref:uncharacterized protein C6orf132 homolog n=1 Tax=Schistocerca piceifrons TaxID=274613 RepID=UPI001F5E4735|nr:uncharacterized protein C6orf132 homolog [Schistocerca piceifrons]
MGDECEVCAGAGPGPPPPQFLVPPPPRPPFLPDDEHCLQEDQLPSDVCDALPVIDAELHSGPALPSLAVIAVSSAILAAVVLIAGVLVWKYKRKPPVLMPCKPSAQGIDPGTMGYDDLPGAHVAARQMRAAAAQHPPEMIDMKPNVVYPNGYRGPEEPTVFICSDPYSKEELYNPVYQELSPVSTERGESDLESEIPVSEDDFAEDELSLGEVGPRRHHHPHGAHQHQHHPAQGHHGRVPPPPPPHRRAPPPPHPALAAGVPPVPFHNRPEHRRHGGGGGGGGGGSGAGSDFHEGLLVDALLQHQQPLTLSASQHYASAPCYRLAKPPPEGALAETSFSTFRPQHATSHDSDSGYSHNTSSGHHGPRSATGSLKMS